MRGCSGNGIGLNCIEDKTISRDQCNRKDNPEPFLFQALSNVISWTTTELLVFVISHLKQLCQRGFNEGRTHAQKGSKPHPEHCTGATNGNRNGNTRDITDPDPAGQPSDKGLKWSNTMRIFHFTTAAFHDFHTVPEQTNLYRT